MKHSLRYLDQFGKQGPSAATFEPIYETTSEYISEPQNIEYRTTEFRRTAVFLASGVPRVKLRLCVYARPSNRG